jgi:hypothetical protein
MLGKAELERLRLQKELLVLQSDANRFILAAEWQRLRSAETWSNEAGSLARRHPIWTAVLAMAAGSLAAKTVRRPSAVAGGLGRISRFASLAFAAWRLFKRRNPSL